MSDERAAGGERRATRIRAARQTTERLARVIGLRQSRAPSPQVLVTFLACPLLCALPSCLASSRAAQSVVSSLSVVPVSLTAAVALIDSAGLSSTLGFSLSPGRAGQATQRNATQQTKPIQYNTVQDRAGQANTSMCSGQLALSARSTQRSSICGCKWSLSQTGLGPCHACHACPPARLPACHACTCTRRRPSPRRVALPLEPSRLRH
jgi:hypothetical protein